MTKSSDHGVDKTWCPVPFCGEKIPLTQNMCRWHWQRVDQKLRRRIHKERAIGEGWDQHPTLGYTLAMEDAIEDLKKRGELG